MDDKAMIQINNIFRKKELLKEIFLNKDMNYVIEVLKKNNIIVDKQDIEEFKYKIAQQVIKTNDNIYSEESGFCIEEYIENLKEYLPTGIIKEDVLEKYKNSFKDIMKIKTDEVVLETHLLDSKSEVDFSIKIDKNFISEFDEVMNNDNMKKNIFENKIWNKINNYRVLWENEKDKVDNIWFEVDYETMNNGIVNPCIFIDGINICNNNYIEHLKYLLDKETLKDLEGNIKRVVDIILKKSNIFQFGVMLSRKEKALRIFTYELTYLEYIECLKKLEWKGDFSQLESIFEFLNVFSEKQYILDFNVYEDGISEKIGINFGVMNNAVLSKFLDKLFSIGLCVEEKRKEILNWTKIYNGRISREISHIKMSIYKDMVDIKFYLRVCPNIDGYKCVRSIINKE